MPATGGRSSAAAALLLPAAASAATPALPPHTVSGFSSGGDMSMIHFVAYSGAVTGVGVIAGAPYGCNVVAPPNGWQTECGAPSHADRWPQYLQQADDYLLKRAAAGQIDPTENIRGKPAYLYCGTKDATVRTVVMENVRRQLANFSADIAAEFTVPASHAWVVDDYVCPKPGPGSCGGCTDAHLPNDAAVNNCGYDLAGAMLRHIVSPRRRSWARGRGLGARLYVVPQGPYIPGGAAPETIGFDATGLLYVPKGCEGGGLANCSVHVHYHGCECGKSFVGTNQVQLLGLHEWAEPNGVVVLYPQLRLWAKDAEGCWDWVGTEVGSDFDTHTGKQVGTVAAMLRDLPRLVASRTHPTRYHCVVSTKQCVVQVVGHSTLDKCVSACGGGYPPPTPPPAPPPAPPPPPPPSADSYVCDSGRCVAAPGGVPLATCRAACV